LKKEAKKAVANKGLNIPASVAYVINAVYIDKICTLSELRSEDGVAYSECKRWVREQREKRKQDPLPSVKQELVKVTIAHLYCDVTATCNGGAMIVAQRWLETDPAGRLTTRSVKSNRIGTGIYARSRHSVVLDEVSNYTGHSQHHSA
jgi:hypothetical protein